MINYSYRKYIVFLFMFIFNQLFSELPELKLMDSLCDSKESHFEKTEESLKEQDLKNGILNNYNIEKPSILSEIFRKHLNDNDYINGIISFCRAHAVLSSSSLRAFKNINMSNLNSQIIDKLKNAKDDCKITSRCGINENDSDFMKVRLLAFSLSWDDYLSVFKNVFKEGVFHDFSSDEALFVLYSHPIINSIKWYFVNKEDKDCYVECLAGALRTFIREKYKVEVDFKKDGLKAKTAIAKTYLERIGILASSYKKDE
ncbi:MAG: hypothetical protein IJ730_05830 [Alphaproteobacteria bacterium]|nr:hypothetical protein [Alphaproteobacteria bacterium]